MKRLRFSKCLVPVTLGLLLAGIAGLSGCNSQPAYQVPPTAQNGAAPASAQATTANSVSIAGFAFSPSTVTVPVGTTVTWTNKDSAEHTVIGDGFKSNNLSKGGSFSFTFGQAGTFQYRCGYHPGMTGKVVVTP